MSAQAQLMRGRVASVSEDEPTQPAPYGAGPSSEPHITLSPQAPAPGRSTTGFLVMLIGTDVSTLTIWVRDPATGLWGFLADYSSSDDEPLEVFKWITICGVNACELYFETDAEDEDGDGPTAVVIETSGG